MAERYVLPSGNQTIADLMLSANSYSENWLGVGMLLAVFCVVFFALRAYSPSRAFASASFITAIIATFFRVLNIINDLIFWSTLIMAIIGFVAIYIESNKRSF